MVRKWIAFGLLFGFVGLIGFVAGCGQAQQAAAPTGQAVSITGTVTASNADLSALGVSALSIKKDDDQTAYLKSLGVSDARLYGIIKPMAVTDAVATLKVLNDDGSFTTTSSTATVTAGTYTLKVTDYDSDKQYAVTVSKTSSDTGKTLEMTGLVGNLSNNSAVVAIDAKADLVAKTIINQVVKVLRSAKVDKAVIDQVKDVIIATVNSMITAGTITVPSMVRESIATENDAANQAAAVLAESGSAKNALDAIKYKAGFTTATTTEDAKGVIREIFTALIGDPRGMPDEIITVLAAQLLKGTTKTITELAAALNTAYRTAGDDTVPAGSQITASTIASTLSTKLSSLYSIVESPSSGQMDARLAVYLAAFPKDTWKGVAISGSTTLNVPQGILVIESGFNYANEKGWMFAPGLAMDALFPGTFTNALSIMHYEMRIVSYFDPSHPEEGATPALESFLQVGNMLNEFDVTQVAGVTATLTYPTAAGGTATVDYQAFSPMMQPESVKASAIVRAFEVEPLGMKMFNITPYNWGGSTPQVITNFKAGTATIKVYKAGSEIASKNVQIIDTANFLKINVAFKVPKQTFDPSQAEKFPVGASPVISWVVSGDAGAAVTSLVPSGYRLAYALMIFQRDQYGGSPFFQSWDRQEFIEGTTFPLSSTGKTLAVGSYDVEISTVLLEQDGRFPVAEGSRAHTIFTVASSADVVSQTGDIILEGTVTLAQGQSTDNLRVGLFYADAWTTPLTPIVPAVSLLGGNTYKITVSLNDFANYGRYELRAWIDGNSNGKIEDPMSGGTEFFTPCMTKEIFKEQMGVKVFNRQTNQGSMLKESPTGFDITMMSGWAPAP